MEIPPAPTGTVVVLNGAPRSGKTSIAAQLGAVGGDPWMNVGVDSVMATTPPEFLPGIGLRPGGERPDLEDFVVQSYQDLFESVVVYAMSGTNVAVDVGIHDSYSQPLRILDGAASRLAGTRTYLVGVRCSLETVVARRRAGTTVHGGAYLSSTPDQFVPQPVVRWQTEVHRPGQYDLEVDTTVMTARDAALRIIDHLSRCEPWVFPDLRSGSRS